MDLKQSTRKFKFENQTTYYFEKDNELVSQLILSKQKSGYEIEYNNYNLNVFRRTDGLKDMNQVKKFISQF